VRIARYEQTGLAAAAFYFDDFLVPVASAAVAYQRATGSALAVPDDDDLLRLLPPDGEAHQEAETLYAWSGENLDQFDTGVKLATDHVQLLVPIPRPNKLFLLAGNYAAHIEEGGGIAAERAETFPYVFMKPPTTTLTDPGRPVIVPRVSPDYIDWELELAVIIGRKCKGVQESEALDYRVLAEYNLRQLTGIQQFEPDTIPNRRHRVVERFKKRLREDDWPPSSGL